MSPLGIQHRDVQSAVRYHRMTGPRPGGFVGLRDLIPDHVRVEVEQIEAATSDVVGELVAAVMGPA